jgi:poly(A) polymerase
MILIAQRTLTGQRRRRGPLSSFRRHPLFREAMEVFEISVEATGEYREQLEAWRSGNAPQPAPDAEGPRKRKRRRRRRRGQGPSIVGGSPPPGQEQGVAGPTEEAGADEPETDDDSESDGEPDAAGEEN